MNKPSTNVISLDIQDALVYYTNMGANTFGGALWIDFAPCGIFNVNSGDLNVNRMNFFTEFFERKPTFAFTGMA